MIGLLELVVIGKVEASKALAEWPSTATGEHLISAAWHDLAHFVADDDIRQKDIRYAEYQLELLAKRIAQIRDAYGLKGQSRS